MTAAPPKATRCGRVGLAVLLGMLALLVASAPAAAAKKKAKFKFTVSGSQTTTFNETSPPIEDYPGCVGSGQEDVTFTAQPVKVSVELSEGAGGSKFPVFRFLKPQPTAFVVNAVIHRAQTWTVSAACPALTCEATGQASWKLLFLGAPDYNNTVTIQEARRPGVDPIKGSCPQPPAGGSYFPVLLSRNLQPSTHAGKLLAKGKLSNKALFSKKKKLTSNGQGSQRVDFFGESYGGDGTANTSTSWTVHLERIGKH